MTEPALPARTGGGLWQLTKGADGCHHAQGLPVCPRLHVFGHLQHLALQEFGRPTGGLGDLQSAQDVALGIGKGLALLERDAGGQAVPMLADETHELEHDLLAGEHARVPPCGEGLLGTVDGGLELGIGRLRDSGHQVVGCRIVELDPLVGLRGLELIVDEPRRVLRLGNPVVILGEAGGCGCQSAVRPQMLGGSRQAPRGRSPGGHGRRQRGCNQGDGRGEARCGAAGTNNDASRRGQAVHRGNQNRTKGASTGTKQ